VWAVAGLAVLAGALVLLTPGESQAQRRGGGWGGGRGGWSGGIGYNSFGGLNAGIGYGRGFGGYGYGYPGYGYGGYGLGYGGYGYGGYGLGYGRGYGGYGLGYGGYGGYYSPSYYSASPAYYGGDYYGGDYYGGSPSYAYNSPTVGYQSFYPQGNYSQQQQPDNNRAYITVMVPADAEVYFDGAPTQQRGPVRTFTTPVLDTGRNYTYQVRAKWTQNGQPMDQTRSLQVQPGRTATVDFNGAAPQQPPLNNQQQPLTNQQPPPNNQQQPAPPRNNTPPRNDNPPL